MVHFQRWQCQSPATRQQYQILPCYQNITQGFPPLKDLHCSSYSPYLHFQKPYRRSRPTTATTTARLHHQSTNLRPVRTHIRPGLFLVNGRLPAVLSPRNGKLPVVSNFTYIFTIYKFQIKIFLIQLSLHWMVIIVDGSSRKPSC